MFHNQLAFDEEARCALLLHALAAEGVEVIPQARTFRSGGEKTNCTTARAMPDFRLRQDFLYRRKDCALPPALRGVRTKRLRRFSPVSRKLFNEVVVPMRATVWLFQTGPDGSLWVGRAAPLVLPAWGGPNQKVVNEAQCSIVHANVDFSRLARLFDLHLNKLKSSFWSGGAQ